ncbi:hypothetical protein HW132_03090 [Brasilonema sp. CT11]|nr:hypothetical protein [Brasilonema sp. CT11]
MKGSLLVNTFPTRQQNFSILPETPKIEKVQSIANYAFGRIPSSFKQMDFVEQRKAIACHNSAKQFKWQWFAAPVFCHLIAH